MPHHWVPKQEMADHETIVLDVIQCLTETGHDILGQYLYRGVAQGGIVVVEQVPTLLFGHPIGQLLQVKFSD